MSSRSAPAERPMNATMEKPTRPSVNSIAFMSDFRIVIASASFGLRLDRSDYGQQARDDGEPSVASR